MTMYVFFWGKWFSHNWKIRRFTHSRKKEDGIFTADTTKMQIYPSDRKYEGGPTKISVKLKIKIKSTRMIANHNKQVG